MIAGRFGPLLACVLLSVCERVPPVGVLAPVTSDSAARPRADVIECQRGRMSHGLASFVLLTYPEEFGEQGIAMMVKVVVKSILQSILENVNNSQQVMELMVAQSKAVHASVQDATVPHRTGRIGPWPGHTSLRFNTVLAADDAHRTIETLQQERMSGE